MRNDNGPIWSARVQFRSEPLKGFVMLRSSVYGPKFAICRAHSDSPVVSHCLSGFVTCDPWVPEQPEVCPQRTAEKRDVPYDQPFILQDVNLGTGCAFSHLDSKLRQGFTVILVIPQDVDDWSFRKLRLRPTNAVGSNVNVTGKNYDVGSGMRGLKVLKLEMQIAEDTESHHVLV